VSFGIRHKSLDANIANERLDIVSEGHLHLTVFFVLLSHTIVRNMHAASLHYKYCNFNFHIKHYTSLFKVCLLTSLSQIVTDVIES